MLPHVLVACLFLAVAIAAPLETNSAGAPLELSYIPNDAEGDVIPVRGPEESGEDGEDGEMLHTASSIVFRPLFAYRKQMSQRRRVYANKNNNRRQQTSRPQGYPYGYPSYGYPYYMDREFPHVP